MTTDASPSPAAATLQRHPAIKVLGIGGAGLRAAEQIMRSALEGVAVAGVHTAARALDRSAVPEKLLLGADLIRGLGARGDPDLGRAAAEAQSQQLAQMCAGVDLVILVAGMGGGTGSGSTPVVARVARESGALVLGLVTLPFGFEGARRRQQAQAAMRALKIAADAVICLSNDKVTGLVDAKTTLVDTLTITNDMLARGVRGIWRLVSQPGLIPVDFADLCAVVRGRQAESCFATAEAMGENRSREVVEQLVANPLLDGGRVLAGADAVLVSVAGGADLTLKEVNLVMDQINRLCDRAQVLMGASVDAAFAERLSVTIVATKRSAPEETLPAEPGRLAGAENAPGALASASPEAETQLVNRTTEERPPSRFVAPPPPLTEAEAERILARQGGGRGRRKQRSRFHQQMLPLEVVSKGRFAKCDSTVHHGENLDTPTYIRRGVALN